SEEFIPIDIRDTNIVLERHRADIEDDERLLVLREIRSQLRRRVDDPLEHSFRISEHVGIGRDEIKELIADVLAAVHPKPHCSKLRPVATKQLMRDVERRVLVGQMEFKHLRLRIDDLLKIVVANDKAPSAPTKPIRLLPLATLRQTSLRKHLVF